MERFEASAADGSLVIGGRFEVIERLGQPGMGGSGSVYKAFDRTLDRFVAIKVMAPSELLEATREAQTLARMRHRNVVAIHDYGSAPGYRYLVLEFVERNDSYGGAIVTGGPGCTGPETPGAQGNEQDRGCQAQPERCSTHRAHQREQPLGQRGAAGYANQGQQHREPRRMGT